MQAVKPAVVSLVLPLEEAKRAKATLNFQDLGDLGYGKRLVPIIPYDAQVSESSSFHKLVGKPGDSRGKAVGYKGRDGLWRGFDWIKHTVDEDDPHRWQRMGAGGGIKTGEGLIAIDADILDKARAKAVSAILDNRIGEVPARIGRSPKCLYVVRVSEPVPYMRVEFGDRDEKGRLTERVEVLSTNRQFVAFGIHPKTSKPYTWPRPLVPFDQLTIITPGDLHALLDEIRKAMPSAEAIVTEGSSTRKNVNQEALRGDIEMIRKAVSLIPNTSKHFPSRDDYIKFGYAVKAALPDRPDEALSIYLDWCDRWEDGVNEHELAEADWGRMHAPFEIGASWLYELAAEHSPDKFSLADVWFDPIEAPDLSPFDIAAECEQRADAEEGEALAWIDPTKWEGQPLPAREWEVEGWVPKGEVTLLYGDGGVGKSLLMQQYATCAAASLDWLGQKTRATRVMGFFCEDDEEELHRRQHDINSALGITYSDLTNLRLLSRKYQDNLLAIWNRNTGEMQRQAVWKQLRDDAEDFRAGVIVVDTIADTYGGSEIDRTQVNSFVKSCLGQLAQEIGGSVIALGHPSQSGKSSKTGTSGSTAWNNAARSRLYLRRPEGADHGNIRELEGMKLNYGPKGSLLKLRWARGAFEVLAGSQPAVAAASQTSVKSVGDAAADAIVSVLLSHSGERMNLTRNSQYFAPKVLKRLDPETLAPFNPGEIEAAISRLERQNIIRAEPVGRDAGYRPVPGYVVVLDNLRRADDSVFG